MARELHIFWKGASMTSMFRNLTADEIEVRVGRLTEKRVELLLYKNARCDMAILDEAVTPMGWQREHFGVCGKLLCRVGIRGDDGEWVWKADAGSPSNFEAAKGEASDSFKRACFNWGIGRELYTTPRISFWVEQDGRRMCDVRQDMNGKWMTYDQFSVKKVEIEDHAIKRLWVVNDTLQQTVFVWNPDD